MKKKLARKNEVKAESTHHDLDCGQKGRRRRAFKIAVRIRQLKLEFAVRRKEQNEIKAGQRKNQQQLNANHNDCIQVRKEMDLLMQQNVSTQNRLNLMSQILEARENNNFARAADLTRTLRELVRDSTNKKELVQRKAGN